MPVIETLTYHVIPPLFLVAFPIFVQILAKIGNPNVPFQLSFALGNEFGWKFILVSIIWALISLWIPSKKFNGPTTYFGYTPVYQANGELYYFTTSLAYGGLLYLYPDLSVTIYLNMGAILGGLNIVAFLLCLFLLIKAKMDKNIKDPYLKTSKHPIAHEFYRGMELHPRILGVDVKQLTNCRVGLMLWQIFVMTFLVAGARLNGLDYGLLANVCIQTVYLYKFFRWETGYFNTLDITLDRAGYYICWGCLVWVPMFYTFTSYFFVAHRPNSSPTSAAAIFALGIAAIYCTYEVDRQKEIFRTKGIQCKIWGKQAEYISVKYKNESGKERETHLLTSGWWGVARKINYTFEIIGSFLWSIPAGMDFGLWPFLYTLFLCVLLVHRVFRDEEKCRNKYGKGWDQYCKKVPYRLIPYVF